MKGRPVLGAISGFLFGIFLAIALQQWSIRPLDNFSVIGLPIIGLALGLASAYWAPFGGGDADVATKEPSGSESIA